MSIWRVSTKAATLGVDQTGNGNLEPVLLVARGRSFTYQDYLTPSQARELGQRLIAVAEATEEVGPSPSFDEVVDRKMAELKFIDVAVPGEPSVSERMDRIGVPEVSAS